MKQYFPKNNTSRHKYLLVQRGWFFPSLFFFSEMERIFIEKFLSSRDFFFFYENGGNKNSLKNETTSKFCVSHVERYKMLWIAFKIGGISHRFSLSFIFFLFVKSQESQTSQFLHVTLYQKKWTQIVICLRFKTSQQKKVQAQGKFVKNSTHMCDKKRRREEYLKQLLKHN